MNAKMNRIIKVSKVLNIIARIIAIALVVGSVAAAVSFFIIPSFDFPVSFGGIYGQEQYIAGASEVQIMMIQTVLYAGVGAILFFITSFIFKDMSLGNTPFSAANSNRLKVISLLLVAYSVVIPPLQLFLSLIISPQASIFISPINFGLLVFAAMFFCLALIFEYGAELQRESDEML